MGEWGKVRGWGKDMGYRDPTRDQIQSGDRPEMVITALGMTIYFYFILISYFILHKAAS